MRESIKWGLIFGGIAFVANILLPGCIEPFVALLAAFLSAVFTVRSAQISDRGDAIRSGIAAGSVTGGVIICTDFLLSIVLAICYFYRDQIPWFHVPQDLPFSLSIGNVTLVILGVFLCMGGIKVGMALLGGFMGGAMFIRRKIQAQNS